MSKVIMIQGTHSNAGKSLVATALCRVFAQDGLSAAPFKAQNMSLNAGVSINGGEMGRAQIAQAEAAGIQPHTDMNPILLKPESNIGSQVIINGKVYASMKAVEYYREKEQFWQIVVEALDRLRSEYDIVVIEGAGSPAEINLKTNDIVNMRVALYTNAPVVLVGDIDRGGVFAALLGTVMLLEPEERERVKGFLINKFRGDISLMGNGLESLKKIAYGIPTLGILPFLPDPGIAEEDSVTLDERIKSTTRWNYKNIEILIINYPHMSNFDEFDALLKEPGVSIRYIKNGDDIGYPDAVILPGSKMTCMDLDWLRKTGYADWLMKYVEAGGVVVGICGGYQMMGKKLSDPLNVESSNCDNFLGLNFLPVETQFMPEKITCRTDARIITKHGLFSELNGSVLHGYQIHSGVTDRREGIEPLLLIDGKEDGAISKNGKIWGCYFHGLFDNDIFRHSWLRFLGWQENGNLFKRQQAYDRLALHFRKHVDIEKIYQMINESKS